MRGYRIYKREKIGAKKKYFIGMKTGASQYRWSDLIKEAKIYNSIQNAKRDLFIVEEIGKEVGLKPGDKLYIEGV